MADNFKTISDLDISFKEFMPGQIIQSAQFNDDMKDIEEKVNEVIGQHNEVASTVVDHLNNKNNPHEVTAHQVGTYTTTEIDEFIEDVKHGHLYDRSITNSVLADWSVDNRTIKDRTITASKVDDGFGNQIDISENIEITDRYTKSEVDELVRSKVGEGAYTKEEIDQKFEEFQSGQIIDKTISADKVTSDFGDNIDISNNTSITNRYTKGEVDRLISMNGLPRDWGNITEQVDVDTGTGSLPVAGHMVAGQFVSPATSVLDIDVKENIEARGEYNSVGERLDGVDSQIKDIKNNGVISSTVGDSFSSWLAIGDSITVGYNNGNYSYADIIAKKYGVYMVKDAVTGSNIASDSDKFGPGFVNRVDNNGADFNLITVMGGLNDFSHATVTLGTFDPNIAITGSIRNFYDGVTILCKKLITKYPNSKIVFLSSNRDNTYNNIHGESYEQFMQAIGTVCSYFSIPFYRIDDLCGYNRDVYVNQGIDNGDLNINDIHPKTLGHRKIAGAICDCINFVNPVDAWGKGTLNITQLSSTIASNATMSEVREALTVKIVYENGIEFTITDYNITGNITEGTTTFTIDYRGITSTVTFTTGEASGTGITPVYQMAEPYTVSGLGSKTYDTGYSPFTEQCPITIRISANITSFDNTNAMTLMSCSNPSAVVQFAGFNLYLAKNGIITIYTSGSGTLVVPKNISTGEQLKWTDGAFDLFIVYDGNTTITVYVVSNGNILEQRSNASVTFSSDRWNDWTLKLFSTGTSSTQGAEGTVDVLKVYNTAFTEQDVLNNI